MKSKKCYCFLSRTRILKKEKETEILHFFLSILLNIEFLTLFNGTFTTYFF